VKFRIGAYTISATIVEVPELTLSAQEQAIANGKTVVRGTVTDRVLRLFEAVQGAAREFRKEPHDGKIAHRLPRPPR
jgi:hypothetical protein